MEARPLAGGPSANDGADRRADYGANDQRGRLENAAARAGAVSLPFNVNRTIDAAKQAIESPLLETSIQGAKRLLVNVTAGEDFSIGEAHEAMEYILQFTDASDAARIGRITTTGVITLFDEGVRLEYWSLIRGQPERSHETVANR